VQIYFYSVVDGKVAELGCKRLFPNFKTIHSSGGRAAAAPVKQRADCVSPIFKAPFDPAVRQVADPAVYPKFPCGQLGIAAKVHPLDETADYYVYSAIHHAIPVAGY
jgi:hypothetical protein